MLSRSALILVAAGLIAASPIQGETLLEREDRSSVANWAAPLYWQPGTETETANARGTLGALSVTPIDPAPLPFVAISPCRVADTRAGMGFSGPYGPPSLTGGSERVYPLAGQCGIPVTARAVSVNFTVTNTTGVGFLAAYPAGSDYPGTSTLNFIAGQAVVNAAVVALSSTGGMTALAAGSGFDLIIDVNGYYANPSTASSGAFDAKQVAMLRWYEAARPVAAAVVLPSPLPWGMAFDGLYLWVASAGRVSKVLPSTNVVVNSYPIPGDSLYEGSLAFDGRYMWVVGDTTGTPIKRIWVANGSIADVPVDGVNYARGIAFDGTSIWVSCDNKLVKLHPSSGALLATVPLPSSQPRDVIFDGTYVWVANSNATGTVTRVPANGPLTPVEFATGGAYPSALAYDGANVWVTNFDSASVSKIRASDGVLIATVAVGAEPRGLVFDGVNIWVSCSLSDNVYKLRAATAQPVGTPIPIWWGVDKIGFDGATVWVGGGNTTGYLGRL